MASPAAAAQPSLPHSWQGGDKDSSSSASSSSADEAKGSTMLARKRRSIPRCNEQVFLKSVKIALRVFGAIVSTVFIFQGVWIFAHPDLGIDSDHFAAFCRWFSQGMLGVLAGAAGCYLEVKALFTRENFTKYALNRIASAVFYLWLGFWTIGFADYRETGIPSGWMIVVGILSWIVAVGDLMVSCTSTHLVATNGKGNSAQAGDKHGQAHHDSSDDDDDDDDDDDNDVEQGRQDEQPLSPKPGARAASTTTAPASTLPPNMQTVQWNSDAFSRPFGAA